MYHDLRGMYHDLRHRTLMPILGAIASPPNGETSLEVTPTIFRSLLMRLGRAWNESSTTPNVRRWRKVRA